jgi:hypothetical protein
MSTIAILTCFANIRCGMHAFPVDYTLSDMRSIFCYLQNYTRIPNHNIYLFTDIEIAANETKTLLEEYYQKTSSLFSSLYRLPPPPCPAVGKGAGRELIHRYAQTAQRDENEIRKQLRALWQPKISLYRTIEYIYLFANYTKIKATAQYLQAVGEVFQGISRRLFWYYSGHGVLHYQERNEPGMLIPCQKENSSGLSEIREGKKECQLLSATEIGNLFSLLSSDTSVIAIADCCHAEALFQPGRSSIRARMAILASSKHFQKSGFYQGRDGYGSLFTRFLIAYLVEARNREKRFFQKIVDSLSPRINEHRKEVGKRDQVICIITTRSGLNRLPKWLCCRFDRPTNLEAVS